MAAARASQAASEAAQADAEAALEEAEAAAERLVHERTDDSWRRANPNSSPDP